MPATEITAHQRIAIMKTLRTDSPKWAIYQRHNNLGVVLFEISDQLDLILSTDGRATLCGQVIEMPHDFVVEVVCRSAGSIIPEILDSIRENERIATMLSFKAGRRRMQHLRDADERRAEFHRGVVAREKQIIGLLEKRAA